MELPEPVGGSLLHHLRPMSRDRLISAGVRRDFGPNELLHRAGDPADHVQIIISGWVRVSASARDGRVMLLSICGPGDVLGDLAAINGWPRTAAVQSIEHVDLAQLTRAQFLDALESSSELCIAMMKSMSVRWRATESARLDAATMSVGGRVAALLLRLAAEHGVRRPEGLVIEMPLSQQDVADAVGASRRAVTRVLAAFRDRDIVTTGRRRLVVTRPDALRAAAR